MPSSLVWSSEDSSLGFEQWHIKAQGIKAKIAINGFDVDVSLLVSDTLSSVLESWFLLFLIEGLSPTLAVFGSCIDDADSPPCFDSFTLWPVLLFGALRYFFDLKTPGSAGSAPAHHMYKPNADIICEDKSVEIKFDSLSLVNDFI